MLVSQGFQRIVPVLLEEFEIHGKESFVVSPIFVVLLSNVFIN